MIRLLTVVNVTRLSGRISLNTVCATLTVIVREEELLSAIRRWHSTCGSNLCKLLQIAIEKLGLAERGRGPKENTNSRCCCVANQNARLFATKFPDFTRGSRERRSSGPTRVKPA